MAIRTNYTSDEIYDLMKIKVNEFTNKPTFWGAGSVIGGFFRAISYFVEFLQLQINLAYLAFTVKTAEGGHLLRRLSDFGMTPYTQVYAIVDQTFYGDVGRTTDILIPTGTIVKTDQINGDTKFYELVSDIILPSSENSVKGLCVCTVAGTYGNTAINTITSLSVPIIGISSTTNTEEVINGAENESVDQMRERLPLYLLGLKKGNEDAILDAVYSIEGITIVKVVENHPAIGNFTVYVSTESGVIDSILLEKIKAKIDSVKALCVTYSIVVPIISNITISFDLNINSQIYNQNDLKYIVLSRVKSYINSSKKSSVYISDIIKEVKAIVGVINIKNVTINNIADDLTLNEVYVAKINSDSDITINII